MAVESLAPAECGRLLIALLKYAQNQEPQNLCGREKKVFDQIAKEIDEERMCESAHDLCESAHEPAQDIYINNNLYAQSLKENTENTENTQTLSLQTTFAMFWGAYPNGYRTNRKRCVALWEKIKPDDKLLAKMLRSIEAWKKTRQWKEGYVPNPDTWLRNEKWEDEVPPAVTTNRGNDRYGGRNFNERVVRMEDLETI